MKLILQIAAGIVLAIVAMVGSVSLYKYIDAQRTANREASALHLLFNITPTNVTNRCGAPIYRKTEHMAGEDWEVLTYVSSAVAHGPVDLIVAPSHLVNFKVGDNAVESWSERLRILPCLAGPDANAAAAK